MASSSFFPGGSGYSQVVAIQAAVAAALGYQTGAQTAQTAAQVAQAASAASAAASAASAALAAATVIGVQTFNSRSGTVTLLASDLPAPTASTFGGVKSKAAVANNFLTSVGTDGIPVLAQPTFANLSGVATSAQLPNPAAAALGGVMSKAAVTNNFLTQIGTDGSVTQAQPAFTNISGSVAPAQLPNPAAAALGGTQSKAVVASNFLTGISTSGVVTAAQPAASDISGLAPVATSGSAADLSAGTLLAARMPAYTGDVTTVAGAVATTIAALAVTNGKLAAVNQYGKQSIWVPATSMTARVTNGAATGTTESTTNKVQITGLDFDPATNQYAQFSVWMPKSYDAGTVTAQFVWEHPSTTTNFAAVWGLQAFALGDNTTLDTAFGTAQEVTDTGGTTGNQYNSPETSAITIANTPAGEKTVWFQAYRNAASGSDTLAVASRLLGVRILYNTTAQNDT